MEMEENFSETNTEIILRDRNAFKEIYTSDHKASVLKVNFNQIKCFSTQSSLTLRGA
jgi:hypothetical protein